MADKKAEKPPAEPETEKRDSYGDVLTPELKAKVKEFISKIENQERWPYLNGFVQEAVREKLEKEMRR